MSGNFRLAMEFLTTAGDPSGWPNDDVPEIALAGRSNAGKSSLINALADKKNLAKVSSAPGKTRTLNFFDVAHKYRIVDMPGYGFASRSGSEQKSWQKLVETYLSGRKNLVGVLLVMDMRRDWDDDEKLMASWTQQRGLPMAVALTKSDKLNRSDTAKRYKAILDQSNLTEVFLTSALKKTGLADLEGHIYSSWIRERARL